MDNDGVDKPYFDFRIFRRYIIIGFAVWVIVTVHIDFYHIITNNMIIFHGFITDFFLMQMNILIDFLYSSKACQ